MTNRKIQRTIVFEVGGRYECTTLTGDRIIFECYKRSNRFVWLRDTSYDRNASAGISVTSEGAEYCYPLGRYASRPILLAKNRLNDKNQIIED